MPEENADARTPELRRIFPWAEIFRAFQIALDPSKLLLATAAVIALWLGWFVLGAIFRPDPARSTYSIWPANVERGKNPYEVVAVLQDDLFTKRFWLGDEGQAPPIQLE